VDITAADIVKVALFIILLETCYQIAIHLK